LVSKFIDPKLALPLIFFMAVAVFFVSADTVNVGLYAPSRCTPSSCSGSTLRTCTFNTNGGTSSCQFNYDFTNKCGQRGWHKSYATGHQNPAGPQNVYYCGCRNWGGVDSGDCNPSDGAVCTNPNAWEYRDYGCNNAGSCVYTVTSSENCAARSSENIGDTGDVPLVAGSCRDYNGCSAGSCSYADIADSCVSGSSLIEYYAAGASCTAKSYGCPDFELAATDADGGDNPSVNGACTRGTGATCASGAFSTVAGASGADACEGVCGTGNNSCVYREFFVSDSADGCGGSDSCSSRTYDPDTNSNTCTSCGLEWGLPGETGSMCTGDDSNEFVRWRQCAPGSCVSDINDRAACFSQSSCVIKGRCLKDIDEYSQEKCRGENNDTDDCKRYKKRHAREGPDRDKIYNDTDNDGRLEVCDPGTWMTPTASSVKGRVVTVGGFGVNGAEVRILGTDYVRTTATINNVNGSYDFGSSVVNSSLSYDIVASRSPYSPSVLKDVFIPDFADVTIPTITLSYGSDLCEEDCTFTSDETCHASCQGTNGCMFYDVVAAGICDAVHTGFRVDYDATREIQCCEGSPYVPVKIKATTKINATNVVRITRNVWYEGKLVKMVIDVFS